MSGKLLANALDHISNHKLKWARNGEKYEPVYVIESDNEQITYIRMDGKKEKCEKSRVENEPNDSLIAIIICIFQWFICLLEFHAEKFKQDKAEAMNLYVYENQRFEKIQSCHPAYQKEGEENKIYGIFYQQKEKNRFIKSQDIKVFHCIGNVPGMTGETDPNIKSKIQPHSWEHLLQKVKDDELNLKAEQEVREMETQIKDNCAKISKQQSEIQHLIQQNTKQQKEKDELEMQVQKWMNDANDNKQRLEKYNQADLNKNPTAMKTYADFPSESEIVKKFTAIKNGPHQQTHTAFTALIKKYHPSLGKEKYFPGQISHNVLFDISMICYRKMNEYKDNIYNTVSNLLFVKAATKSDKKEEIRKIQFLIHAYLKENYQTILQSDKNIKNDIKNIVFEEIPNNKEYKDYVEPIFKKVEEIKKRLEESDTKNEVLKEEMNFLTYLNSFVEKCIEISWTMVLHVPILLPFPTFFYSTDAFEYYRVNMTPNFEDLTNPDEEEEDPNFDKEKNVKENLESLKTFDKDKHAKCYGSDNASNNILYFIWPTVIRGNIVLDSKMQIVSRSEKFKAPVVKIEVVATNANTQNEGKTDTNTTSVDNQNQKQENTIEIKNDKIETTKKDTPETNEKKIETSNTNEQNVAKDSINNTEKKVDDIHNSTSQTTGDNQQTNETGNNNQQTLETNNNDSNQQAKINSDQQTIETANNNQQTIETNNSGNSQQSEVNNKQQANQINNNDNNQQPNESNNKHQQTNEAKNENTQQAKIDNDQQIETDTNSQQTNHINNGNSQQSETNDDNQQTIKVENNDNSQQSETNNGNQQIIKVENNDDNSQQTIEIKSNEQENNNQQNVANMNRNDNESSTKTENNVGNNNTVEDK